MARAALPVLLIGGLVLGIFVVGRYLGLGPTDDAFIVFRCASNLADNAGPVFNPGERVEAVSNFLFTVAVGGLARLGFDPRAGALGLSLVSLFAVFFFVFAAVRRASGGRLAPSVAAVALLAGFPAVVFYTFVSLETMFYAAFVAAAVWSALDPDGRDRGRFVTGALCGLAAATRMEAIALLPVFVWQAGGKDDGWSPRAALKVVLGFALFFGPVLIFRTAYFGSPLPNTYYAKLAGGEARAFTRGARYTVDFLAVCPAIVCVGAYSLIRSWTKTGGRRARFVAALMGVWMLVVTWEGGDFFALHRFYAPMLPLAAILFGLALGDRCEETRSFPIRVGLATALLIAVTAVTLAAHPWHLPYAAGQIKSAQKRIAVGRMLAGQVPQGTRLLLGAAGAIPYYSELPSRDFFGLTDPLVAKMSVPVGSGLPGHEKTNPSRQVLDWKPGVIVFDTWFQREKNAPKARRRISSISRIHKRLSAPGEPLDGYELRLLENGKVEALVAVQDDVILRDPARDNRVSRTGNRRPGFRPGRPSRARGR